MKTIYVRNVDDRTHAVLIKAAKSKDVSLSELVRQIIDNYAARGDVESIDQKYRSFAADMMALYRADQEDMKKIIEMAARVLAKLEEQIDERGQWD